MIEKIYKNKRMVVCDNCGTGQECDNWAEAIDFMNEEGWKKKLVDGEWKHFCPECVEVDERLSLNPFKLIRDTYRAILKEEKEIDLKRKEFQERWNKWGKDKQREEVSADKQS